MTAIELRQLLFLYTQPSPPKAKFDMSAQTLIRLGYIMRCTHTGTHATNGYVMTDKGLAFVAKLCEFVNSEEPKNEMPTWWHAHPGPSFSTERSTWEGNGRLDPWGRAMLNPSNWKQHVDKDGDTTHWELTILSPDGVPNLITFWNT